MKKNNNNKDYDMQSHSFIAFKQINPNEIKSHQEASLLSHYIKLHQPLVLQKNRVYVYDNKAFKLTHHLVMDQKNQASPIRTYYVIAKGDDSILGTGSFHKLRKIMGVFSIDIASTDPVPNYQSITNKALKIRNYKKRDENNNPYYDLEYNHQKAIDTYFNVLPVDTMNTQAPIRITAGQLKLFDKSYIVIDALPGDPIDEAVIEFIENEKPDTLSIVQRVILPVLETYKKQISDKNYVHRDIKPDNILANFNSKSSLVNFIDLDQVLPLGQPDTKFGSVGYFAPEIADTPNLIVSEARDILSLGMILIGCFNPKLFPDRSLLRLSDPTLKTAPDCFHRYYDYLEAEGSYIQENHPNFFSLMSDDWKADTQDMQNQITKLLSEMTSFYPERRPTLEETIEQFRKIENELYQQKNLTNVLTCKN